MHENLTDTQSFAQAVHEGLGRTPKSLPPKFLYDPQGSALFERICECAEYYVTRTEISILEARAREVARWLGHRPVIFEFGSGASRKTRILLDALPDAAAYVPIDISRDFLFETASELRRAYPRLPIIPVCADFTRPWVMPEQEIPADYGRRVVFFPGSTIGNFDPADAEDFLARTARFLGARGLLLIGFDLLKSREILEAAYDDAEGITAAFNLNLLHRMRRELGAEVDPGGFRHLAIFNERESRIEMHLVSLRPQNIRIRGLCFAFDKGETIHTECSYKYPQARFEELARKAGLVRRAFWTDPRALFGVGLFETA